MLSEREARVLWLWVVAANDWSEASQGLVNDASELSTVSRDLADLLATDHARPSPRSAPRSVDRTALARDLRQLAAAIEDQTAQLRDRYLATAADIEAYQSILA
jgi:hypothetical protein